jgi:acyl-coenzyme A thioesterase PaaI-like protein
MAHSNKMEISRYLSPMTPSTFPSKRRMQWKLFLLGLLKIPMIGYCRPRIADWSPESVRVRIPLRRRTRNHFKSMYFGALMVGADLTAGLHAYAYSLEKGWKVSFAFKSSSAEFLRRPDKNVFFEMDQGREVEALLEKSQASGERHHMGVPIAAYDEEGTRVAEFVLELSVRVKK